MQAGEIVDRYVVESTLGSGASGVVYAVRHRSLGGRYALKLVEVVGSHAMARLQREAAIQAALRHPNIVSVHDLIQMPQGLGIVMDLVDGPTLRTWCHYNPPEPDQALALFIGIVQGVGFAHERGLVHRDLKPDNVLIDTASGLPIPKVADFGLARIVDPNQRLTRTGTIMGTPAYMAPEQSRDSSRVDGRADIFSLGCILYEMCCHQMTFPQNDSTDIANATRAGQYRDPQGLRPDLPAAVVETIQACLRPDPEDRIGSCAELLRRLDAAPIAPASITPWPARTSNTLRSDAPSTFPESWQGQTPGSIGTTPASAFKSEAAPAPKRGKVLPLGIGLALALALGSVAWTLLQSSPVGPPAQAPEVPAELAEGPEPVAEEPELPDRATQGSDNPRPRNPPSDRAPDKAPEQAPEQAPVEPSKTPPKVVEAPPPAPQEAAPKASVRVQGDAEAVWLEQNGRRVELGEVTPGSYTLMAQFSGKAPVPAQKISVLPGQELLLTCTAAFTRCR